MDIKLLSDGDLAKLMIDVGDEMERRRGGRNLHARLTTVITEASAADIPAVEINTAVEMAKAKAQESVRHRTPSEEPAAKVPTPPITPAKAPVNTATPAVAKVK